ncbi:endoglucanase, partial [Mycena sp. CBHHK59/15]
SPAVSVAVWGQCGGLTYTGSTVCDAGSVCVVSNAYYSQCLPGTATTTVATTTTATTTSSAPARVAAPTGQNSRQVWTILCEFGNANIPGTWGKDFTFPAPRFNDSSCMQYFVSKGFNFFRVPFLMERMVPPATGITGPFNSAYLANYTAAINYITGKGAYAAVDPHNYMIYNNAAISSTSDFQKFWTNFAGQFKSNSKVIFDVMNEPNGIPASTAFALNQAAVNGIRASGATTQLILVEAWTGAWTWVSSGNSAVFGAIKDPNNNVAIEMHQYLDSDGSGTSDVCVSSTIGADRLASATAWLQANNLKGFLGEIGGGNNAACIAAVSGAFCSMQQSGVWIGASWWAAGPWWGTYFTSIEPPSGIAVSQVLPQALMPYL